MSDNRTNNSETIEITNSLTQNNSVDEIPVNILLATLEGTTTTNNIRELQTANEIQRREINKYSIVSENNRRRIIENSIEENSVTTMARMYQKNYQTVHSVVKKYLKTGKIFSEPKGKNRRSKLTSEIKRELLAWVDLECTKTLRETVKWIKEKFDVVVSRSTVDWALSEFHYTLKCVTIVPERKNCQSTIDARISYAAEYRILEVNNDDKNFIFIDEVGFAVVTRPSRGRSRVGESAFLNVPADRSQNILVVAAMTKYGMLYHKIYERAVNGNDFILALKEINESSLRFSIDTLIFIMDNARIHRYRGMREDAEISALRINYLPPYSLVLNQIENVFSVW
ncbi:hypothetical protein CDIK_3590, partial [Cucumispora dikerogammari]